MRSLQFARAAARAERTKVGADPEGLFERLIARIAEKGKDLGSHLDVIPLRPAEMDGKRAEVDAEAGVISYDETLNPLERLEVLAHELGHLVIHNRLTDPRVPEDALLNSVYGDAGPAAIARYSPRVREEAEANAFATEFICPSDIVFAMWRDDRDVTIDVLAERLSVTPQVVRMQLAAELHDQAIGSDLSRAAKGREVTLTKEQGSAARSIGHPVLVDAGPGTGKTATLIGRIEYLLGALRSDARQILIVTFSNEAAQELAERIADRFGRAIAQQVTISTFHGLGMEFVCLHGELLGFPEDPRLLDEDAQAEVIYEILGRVACEHVITLRDPWETAVRLVEHINHLKHHLCGPDELARAVQSAGNDPAPLELEGIYREYERTKKAAGRVDFADLILLPLQLLASHTEVRDAWRHKFPWVLVDEFQDVSWATSRLLRALCSTENPPWVVGDARQAIYRFLGASPENVSAFRSDFPDAVQFPLQVNYRSADPIIAAANELAGLMAVGQTATTWTRGSDERPLGAEPLTLAEADSDYAEQVGIVEQVQRWINEERAQPGDIAVLARRHIDVRNIMLGLRDAGIKAQAAGLLTPEGAAGDLAAVLAAAVAPRASVPRLARALGDAADRGELNETVSDLLAGRANESPVAKRVSAVIEAAAREEHCADGWMALTTFLFESSDYLRRVLDADDTAERALTLIEIVSTLSLATAFRATRAGTGTSPKDARIGLGERLRHRLRETVPLPLIPKPRADVVRVMTCHASKGLEFPCVIVAGQTVPRMPEKYPWLPASLRPKANEDEAQADSLLFVGVTRARRAVLVSWPTHAGQGTRARTKHLVPLLESWRKSSGLVPRHWGAKGGTGTTVAAGPVWGLPTRTSLKASALASNACPLLTYMEQYLGVRFPEEATVLYPRFFAAVRRMLRGVAATANGAGRRATGDEAHLIVDKEWPIDRYDDHPHFEMYRGIALATVLGFAQAYRPGAAGSVTLIPELTIGTGDAPTVALDLVAYFREPNGNVVAVAFRPESFVAKAQAGALAWSKLDDNKRISFVLVESKVGTSVPLLYSGKDEVMYDFQWSRNKDSLPKESGELLRRYEALAGGDFSTEVEPFVCDRCRARVSCPFWMGALA